MTKNEIVTIIRKIILEHNNSIEENKLYYLFYENYDHIKGIGLLMVNSEYFIFDDTDPKQSLVSTIPFICKPEYLSKND